MPSTKAYLHFDNFTLLILKINGQLPSKQDSYSKAKISNQILPLKQSMKASQ